LRKQILVGFIVVVLIYPVLANILMYDFGVLKDKLPHGTVWEFIQVFLSGPFLFIIGIILVYKSKIVLNRILGVFLLVISVYWLFRIINEIANES